LFRSKRTFSPSIWKRAKIFPQIQCGQSLIRGPRLMPYFAESTIAEGIQWVNYQTPYCLKNLMKKEDLNHRQRYVTSHSRQGANIFVTRFILDSERDLHDNMERVGIPETHLDNKAARKTFYNPETNLHRSSISPLWSRARQPLDSIVIALRQIGMYLLGKFDLQDRIKALIERKEYSIKWNSVTLAMTIQMMKEIQQIFHSVAGNRDFYSRLLADLLREKRVQIGSWEFKSDDNFGNHIPLFRKSLWTAVYHFLASHKAQNRNSSAIRAIEAQHLKPTWITTSERWFFQGIRGGVLSSSDTISR